MLSNCSHSRNLHAPYALTSAPVILGTLGGIGLIIGPIGLLWLNFKRDALRGDASQKAMDRGFIMLLLLVSATGLLLLVLRDTRFTALWLAIDLGTVMALFVTLPMPNSPTASSAPQRCSNSKSRSACRIGSGSVGSDQLPSMAGSGGLC